MSCSHCKDIIDSECVKYTGDNIEGIDFTAPIDLETLIKILGDTIIDKACEYCLPEGESEGDIIVWNGTSWITDTLGFDYSRTIFVDPINGSNSNNGKDPHKPVATIKYGLSLITAAGTSGWGIVCFPGTYNETLLNQDSNNVEIRDVSYFFMPGAIVNSSGAECFYATTTAGNIIVKGYGVFTSTVNCFRNATSAINYDVHFKKITGGTSGSGAGIGVQQGTHYFKGEEIYSSGGACIDARIGTTTGYVEVDYMDNTSYSGDAPTTFIGKTSGTHTWAINCKLAKGKGNNSNPGVIGIGGNTNSNVTLYYNGNVEYTQASAASFGSAIINSSQDTTSTLIFTGDVKCTTSGFGICSTGGLIVLKNSRVKTTGNYPAIKFDNTPGGGKILAKGCTFINDSATSPIVLFSATTCTLEANGCQFINTSTANGFELNSATQSIILNNCNIITDTGAVSLLVNTATVNTRLINCYAVVATSTSGGGAFTNLIETINVNTNLTTLTY